MNPLNVQAIKKAGKIRAKLGLKMIEPINIFDACADLGLTVRFVDVSMEGLYFAESQAIVISSLRPLPRRVYTCAHEFGHHVFGHDSKVDGLTEGNVNTSCYDKDEYLVDAFAGALLMPVAGVEAEFFKRGWDPKKSTPVQFYTISSIFGTGYSSLITHCKVNGLIDVDKANELDKQKPAKLLQQLMGRAVDKSHFKIVDGKTDLTAIDIEIENYLFLPINMNIEGSHMTKMGKTEYGNVYVANHPGITRAVSNEGAFFIRIQNAGYVGLAENRHLEDKDEDI
jgi:hypothetical protein